MRRLVLAVLLSALICSAQSASAQSQPGPPADSQASAQKKPSAIHAPLVVPAGTMVPLALTSPILRATAKAGASVYAETTFPVAIHNQMAIPPGTFVLGQIDSLTLPGMFSAHAQFQIHFTKIIFANGYTVELPETRDGASAQAEVPAPAEDVIAAVATPYVLVTAANDVLLDNGTQVEMILQVPLRLNAAKVAAAARSAKPALLAQFRSASLCRPIPATSGTSDTVIPGTPGTPGTPDTVIPGGPGMPDIVIPGTPATPGTPDTVIPGMAGSPEIPCPGPPVVASNPKAQNNKKSFQLGAAVQFFGKQMPAGTYQINWQGSGPTAQVDILQGSSVIASGRARVVVLNRKSPADTPGTRANPDGSLALESLRFAGQNFALYFDEGDA